MNFLGRYQKGVNSYLEKFGADFRIMECKEYYWGGRPSLNYRISINNVAVDLDTPEDSVPSPCFRNTLGSGDRSALAFAFFLARLDEDPNLKEKIVVFDDPISSLDNHRRTCTQQELTRLTRLVNQVIVLSHDPYFLQLIWENSLKSNLKTLCIARRSQGSKISEWDIEQATQGEYFQNYSTLAGYLDGNPNMNLYHVVRCIRPLLEGNLRVRFPGQFGRKDTLGDMVNTIRESNEQSPLNCLKLSQPNELFNINEYSKHYHHDQNPNADNYPINDGELKGYVKRTLYIIIGVVRVEAKI